MAAPSEVRIKVRHNVLLLKTFTVPQLQAITGLNRQSIHTEIRRMEQDGLVSRVGTQKRQKRSTGGRPPVTYQLTKDPEKRFEILESVRAFYTAAAEQVSEPARPESKHYYIAKQILEDSIEQETVLTQEEKAARLDSIKNRLKYARQEEIGQDGNRLIAASFDILEAKAMYSLAGDWERAVIMLDEACRVCQKFQADSLVTDAQACVQTMVNRMAEDQLEFDESGAYEEVEKIAQDLRIIKHRFGDLPAISVCIKQVERLAEKARDQQIHLAEARAVQQNRAIAVALTQTQTILIAKVKSEPVEEQWYISELGSEPQVLSSETRYALPQISLRHLLQDTAEPKPEPRRSSLPVDEEIQKLFRGRQVSER